MVEFFCAVVFGCYRCVGDVHLSMLHRLLFFFFFKQKTAYEMRISDWSSDVCSSDLDLTARPAPGHDRFAFHSGQLDHYGRYELQTLEQVQIGRASCRERVCQYV